jgi:hypothetical protein
MIGKAIAVLLLAACTAQARPWEYGLANSWQGMPGPKAYWSMRASAATAGKYYDEIGGYTLQGSANAASSGAFSFLGVGAHSSHADGSSTTWKLMTNTSAVVSFGDGAGNDRSFSFSTWARWKGGTSRGDLACKYYIGATLTREYIFSKLATSHKLYFFWVSTGNNGANAREISTDAAMPLDQWVHVVLTYDVSLDSNTEAQNRANIYVNGVLQAVTRTKYGTYAGMASGSADFVIGDFSGKGTAVGSAGPWIGQIDEFMVFDYALTPEQVKTIYRQSKVVHDNR